MYKIRRVNIKGIFSLCRCYGNQRNPPNHYETLSIKNNSSQKEIRDAFLKLSKKLHPDIGGKENQVEFVKVNEAYKILSKDHTRRQYDMDLQYRSTAAQNGENYRYSENIFHVDPRNFRPQTAQAEAECDENYYGIKGLKRVSNGTVAAICVVVCVVIVSLEMAVLRRSIIKNRQYLQARSLQSEQDYAEAKSASQGITREKQMEAIMTEYELRNKQHNLVEGNNR